MSLVSANSLRTLQRRETRTLTAGLGAPQGVRCRLTAVPSPVRVFGTVNGRSPRLVVDAGSERTFIREDMLDACDVPEATQLLCGVTGECTTMRGPMSVNVGMGDEMERLPVFIADLEDWTTSRG